MNPMFGRVQKVRLTAVLAESLPSVTLAVSVRLCLGRVLGTRPRIGVPVVVLLAASIRLDAQNIFDQSHENNLQGSGNRMPSILKIDGIV